MMTEKKIPKRVRALFALDKLSTQLQRGVLDDSATTTLWDIPTRRMMRLTPDLTVQSNSVFSIFRAAADGKRIPPLVDEKNRKRKAKASIDPRGTGFLELRKHRIRFLHVRLMSGSPEVRLSELERILGSLTLHARLQGELRRIVVRSDYEFDEFITITRALSSAPEEFQIRLSEKASMMRVASSDLLPEDQRHWKNLTAPIRTSTTLTEFIANELAAEHAARLATDPILGFRSIALTCSAPTLVPFEVFGSVDKQTKNRILEDALLLDDHFSLVTAFELCATWIVDDPDFSEVGERLLDRLFGDPKRLETACGIFGAALVLSVAKIAQDEKLKTKPAFWRRLAAASHALLVVRACGVAEIEPMELIRWSMRQSGHPYTFSVLCDFKSDPQWRPEWIDPNILVADVCGRVGGAWSRIPKAKVPASWTERIDKLSNWINEKRYYFLMQYPAVMQGARRPLPPLSQIPADIADLYAELMKEPSLDHLLRMRPAIHVFGPPPEVTETMHKLIGVIRADSSADEDGRVASAIGLLSHVAALLRDTNLANAVAETCIERIAMDDRRETVVEAVHRLIECSAAETENAAGRLFLSRKLEQVCYTIRKPELLAEIIASMEQLKLISRDLDCVLGRALAIAKLGASRSAAA
jgi:hypothetical protein